MLSRRIGERVVIDVPASDTPTRIEVVLMGVDQGRAGIGFDLPRSITVLRKELLLRDRATEQQTGQEEAPGTP